VGGAALQKCLLRCTVEVQRVDAIVYMVGLSSCSSICPAPRRLRRLRRRLRKCRRLRSRC
jgi:hypothetical protein